MYPYVLFIAVLMFLYIANGYHIQKLHRRHDRISEQMVAIVEEAGGDLIIVR